MADFRPKNGHLARVPRRDRTFFFDGKRIRAFKNAQNGLKISILILYNALNRTMEGIFDILSFGRFMKL